jgi:Spy/CpxP family protein refolding chaperone
MKSVKIIISVLTLCVTAFVTTASAQEKGKGRGAMSPEQRITAIETAVGTLTAEQKTKITAILEKAQKDAQAVSQDDREKRMEIMQAANKEVRALLTPEQQTKFDAMPQGGRGGKKKGN